MKMNDINYLIKSYISNYFGMYNVKANQTQNENWLFHFCKHGMLTSQTA